MSTPKKVSPSSLALGAIAVALGTAYYVNRKRAHAEASNPPTGHFMEVQGVRLHYTEHGDPQAPALVLLHGIGSTGAEMELSGLVERAKGQFRVLVFDRPGYGHSQRPEGPLYTPQGQAALFLQALTQLGIERPVVLAHSWATLIALSMALQAPHALKGLVLLSGYFTPSVRPGVLFNSLPAIPGVGGLLAHTVAPLVSRALWGATTWRLFSPAPRALRQSFNERHAKWMSLRPQALRTAAAESAMLIPEALAMLPHHRDLSLPIVIVAGEQDRLVASQWHSKRLQARLPNSRLTLVPHAGHMVHHAAPEAVFKAVREVSAMVTPQAPLDLAEPQILGVPDDMPLSETS